jgi:hypothetical protein
LSGVRSRHFERMGRQMARDFGRMGLDLERGMSPVIDMTRSFGGRSPFAPHYRRFHRLRRRRMWGRRGRFGRVPQILLGMLLLAIVAAVMSRRGDDTNQSQWW